MATSNPDSLSQPDGRLLKAFVADPSVLGLIDAIGHAIDDQIPAQRFDLIQDQIETVLQDHRTEQDDVLEVHREKRRARVCRWRLAELLASLYLTDPLPAKSTPDDDEAVIQPAEDLRPLGQKLADALEDESEARRAEADYLSNRNALRWYPYADPYLRAFSGQPELMSIASTIDSLLPLAVPRHEVASTLPPIRRIERRVYETWEPLLSRLIVHLGESKYQVHSLRALQDSITGERDLARELEDEVSGFLLLSPVLACSPETVQVFFGRLRRLQDHWSDEGISLAPLCWLGVLGHLQVAPLDAPLAKPTSDVLLPWRQALESAAERNVETGGKTRIGADSSQPALREHQESVDGGAVGSPIRVSLDDLISILPDPDTDTNGFFQIFTSVLSENLAAVLSDESGDARIPWSAEAASRLSFFLSISDDEGHLERVKSYWAFPYAILRDSTYTYLIAEETGLSPVDAAGDPAPRHAETIATIVAGLLRSGWAPLANAVLAYHLLLHALHQVPLCGLGHWQKATLDCLRSPGADDVRNALVVMSKVGADERTRAWCSQHCPDSESSREAESKFEQSIRVGRRAIAEEELVHVIGSRKAFEGLDQNTRNWLVDFEVRWREAMPDFGSGEYSGWGNLAVDLWRPFENELQKRLASIWQGESGEEARAFLKRAKNYTVGRRPHIGHYLDMVLERSPPKAVQQAFANTSIDLPALREVARVLVKMKNLRNEGAHAATVTEEELVRFRTKLIRGGLLREFVLAITNTKPTNAEHRGRNH